MNKPKYASFFTNLDEKLLFLSIISVLILSVILISLFQTETVSKSNDLLPKKCNYNRERYFVTDQFTHSGTSILSNSNISIDVLFPSQYNTTKSLWIKENHEIWTLAPDNGIILIMQSINLKIVNGISLGTFGCFGGKNFAYNQKAYLNPITEKISGQVWVTCELSNISIVFDVESYSFIGSIPIPITLAGTHQPASVAVGPNFGFIVYHPNVWYLYSTTPPFAVIKFGNTPGNTAFAMTQAWRGNDNDNHASLYVTTTAPSIVKFDWNSNLDVKSITVTPFQIQAITTSLNEKFLYAIFQINDLLYIYNTNGMTLVPGTFTALTPTPNSLAVGERSSQIIITDSNSIYTTLIDLDPHTGKTITGSEIPIVSDTPGNLNSIRFVQQCPCHFCL